MKKRRIRYIAGYVPSKFGHSLQLWGSTFGLAVASDRPVKFFRWGKLVAALGKRCEKLTSARNGKNMVSLLVMEARKKNGCIFGVLWLYNYFMSGIVSSKREILWIVDESSTSIANWWAGSYHNRLVDFQISFTGVVIYSFACDSRWTQQNHDTSWSFFESLTCYAT